MGSQFPMQFQQYRSAPLTVDTQHAQQKYFKSEDSDPLDDSVLDQSAIDSGLELSPPMVDSRRESFALGGHSLFSPQSADMQSIPSNNPFEAQNTTSFVNMDHSQPGPFMVPGSSWPMGSGSGTGTPVQHFDNGTQDYDGHVGMHGAMAAHNPFTNAGNMFSALGSGNPSMPTSPQGNWVTSQSSNKRTRPGSPVLRGHTDLRRGDGIRKKNARFEIPAERNLGNIDELIQRTHDEAEIKELKQQKRLLRNRQAALDSRQRKKQHTERLEDEKKEFNQMYQSLTEQNEQLQKEVEHMRREKQQYMEYIDGLALEKDEMIRIHTLEAGELRKKVGVLADHIQQLERNSIGSSVPQQNTFVDPYDGFDDMALGGAWDASHFLHDYPVEPEQDVKPSMTLIPTKKNEPQALATTDKNSPQGGLLFMLFLVGAFVLSNRSPQPIPAVSDDIRAASASLLNTVLKDAGVSQDSNGVQPLAPQPSGSTSWSDPSTSIPASNMGPEVSEPSMLAHFGETLTQPTQQQMNEQIFSLSAAQYNGVSSQEFMQTAPSKSTSQGRRNLADALAAMRMTNKQEGAAEVYTRSLLWDQVPGDVVRKFARMVADTNNAQNSQQRDTTKT